MKLISSYCKETNTGCHVCTVVIIQVMVVWEMSQLYIISTFPPPNHFSSYLNQVQSSWTWRCHAPLKCQSKHAARYMDREDHY